MVTRLLPAHLVAGRPAVITDTFALLVAVLAAYLLIEAVCSCAE